MFRHITKRLLPSTRWPIQSSMSPVAVRTFSASPMNFAKAKKAKKVEEETEVEEQPTIDFDEANKSFTQIIEKFTKLAGEIKLGKANPKIFDKLNVHLVKDEDPVSFNTIAQTTVKGRNFLITLFDPNYGKHVINAILGSGLNMSAQADPSNKYSLKVPLPPVNTETKKESVKGLKELFEKFKHGSSKNTSLAAVRSDIKQKFTKTGKKSKNDNDRKMLEDFEKLHKLYVDKLNEIFKSAETSILK